MQCVLFLKDLISLNDIAKYLVSIEWFTEIIVPTEDRTQRQPSTNGIIRLHVWNTLIYFSGQLPLDASKIKKKIS